MLDTLLSIAGRNAYGNIGVGFCLLALGVALACGVEGVVPLLCAVCLLLLALGSLVVCLSRKREASDEMSCAHDGLASSFALKTTLIVLGIACCIGLFTGIAFNLAAMSCLAIGLAMLLYGCSFAWYERG